MEPTLLHLSHSFSSQHKLYWTLGGFVECGLDTVNGNKDFLRAIYFIELDKKNTWYKLVCCQLT